MVYKVKGPEVSETTYSRIQKVTKQEGLESRRKLLSPLAIHRPMSSSYKGQFNIAYIMTERM